MTKNHDDGFPYEQAWLGVRDPSLLADEMVAAGHQLADAAKQGDWSTVFTLLGDAAAPFPVNGWRPGGKAWFTVLHQAAWHGVSADVAAELIRLGALRTLTDSHGRTPYMVRLDRDLDASSTKAALLQNKTLALRSLLRPTPSLLTPERTLALSKHLGEFIDGRVRGLYPGRNPRSVLRYPPVEILEELAGHRVFFPVPGMFGGFEIALCHGYLEVKSWNSTVAGSGQTHLITHEGVIRVDDGYV